MQKVYPLRDVTNLKDLCESSCELYADNIAFLWREKATGEIAQKLYKEVGEEVKELATCLNARGLSGKKVAVMGQNCYPWALSYLAIGSGVGIIVPLDKDYNAGQLSYLIQHSETEAILYHDSLQPVVEESGISCEKIPFSEIPTLLEEGKRLRKEGDTSYEDHKINPLDFGILLYTSGTMGVAKGVMLSQHNVCSNVRQALQGVHFAPEDRGLSMLPLHHTYECTAGFLGFFFSGASIAYNSSLRTLLSDLRDFSPTILVTVPLVLESFYKNILKKYEQIPGGKALLSTQEVLAGALGQGARKKLFGTIHSVFGGRLRLFLVGAALVPPKVFESFWKFGFSVYIGYGLTETSPISIMHSDAYQNPYDIGYPATGVQAKILEPDENGIGELAVKGSNIMLGYYKDPEETARVLQNGWFRTGDLVKQTERGSYMITGRIKSMIVADNGKKIFPEELEDALRVSPFVKECLVYNKPGKRSGHILASIYPDDEALDAKWKTETRGKEETMPDQEKKKIFADFVESINAKFPGYKRIRGFVLRTEPFEKTTTKKIKRNDPANITDCEEEK